MKQKFQQICRKLLWNSLNIINECYTIGYFDHFAQLLYPGNAFFNSCGSRGRKTREYDRSVLVLQLQHELNV